MVYLGYTWFYAQLAPTTIAYMSISFFFFLIISSTFFCFLLWVFQLVLWWFRPFYKLLHQIACAYSVNSLCDLLVFSLQALFFPICIHCNHVGCYCIHYIHSHRLFLQDLSYTHKSCYYFHGQDQDDEVYSSKYMELSTLLRYNGIVYT